MKYQIIHKSGKVIAEAKRITDRYLIQEANSCKMHGLLDEITFLVDGKPADIDIIFKKEDERIDKFYDTHRKIWVIDGVSGLKRKPVWVKK